MLRPPISIPLPKIVGNLLLADPALRDGIFNKSVVYMFEHDRERGSAGFILNHHTGRNVGDLVDAKELKPLKDIPVYYGGPVQDQQLHFVSFSWEGNKLVLDTEVSAEDAIILHHTGDSHLRAFVGHSAWSKGQLAGELDSESWFTAAPPRDLMDKTQDNSLWSYVLSHLSSYHQVVSLTPEDPFLN
ncbi:UPF0301 protein VC_0467 [Rubritalea halochordaticola]|uniref:UPF0301 protein VC_0467 n=1 Tax=Rubritalea halochordaticola TaxID=714537 RepID=A0ABP9UZP4_9BACT